MRSSSAFDLRAFGSQVAFEAAADRWRAARAALRAGIATRRIPPTRAAARWLAANCAAQRAGSLFDNYTVWDKTIF